MPKLVEEVRASDFRTTDGGFVIKKMKSGEYRTQPDGSKRLSFRKSTEIKSDGPLGIPHDDWVKIIGFFVAFYGFLICLFSAFITWNARDGVFAPLYVFLGAFIIVVAGIVLVSVRQYLRSKQEYHPQFASEHGYA